MSVPLSLVVLLGVGFVLCAPASAQSAKNPSELNNQGIADAKAGRFEQGANLLAEALQITPDDAQIKKNLSGMLTDWSVLLQQQGDPDQAATRLQQAIDLDPHNGLAMLRLGDILYLTADRFDDAIGLWKQAYNYAPSSQAPQITQRIAGAQRDRTIERTFDQRQTPHFLIRFDGPSYAEQALSVVQLLDQAYLKLAETVGSPPAQLRVILYSGRDFQRVAGGRDWAAGLYDGRIRLRADELGGPRTADILYHELAHAFLYAEYGAHLPVWIHEGFAQSQEPTQTLTDRQQSLLEGIRSRTSWVPLKWLDRRFTQPSNTEDVERAYMQARFVVGALIERDGMAALQAFLKKLSKGTPIERAFDESFSVTWAKADQGILSP